MEILELVSCLLFDGMILKDSDELLLQLWEGKPSCCWVSNSGFYCHPCPWACRSSLHARQDSERADSVVGELCGMDSEIDLDRQHPFIKLGGGPIEDRGFWYEDNFAGIWKWGCRQS